VSKFGTNWQLQQQNTKRGKKRKANKKKEISADLQDLRYKINYTTYNTNGE